VFITVLLRLLILKRFVPGRYMTKSICVLLADHYPLIHNGVKMTIVDAPDIILVGETSKEIDILPLCRQYQPNILLLATNFPEAPTPHIVSQVRQHCPAVPILMLMDEKEKDNIHQLIAYGASGIFVKSDELGELPKAIRKIVQGDFWYSQSLLKRILHSENRALGDEDMRILRLLIAGKMDKEIAQALQLSERTLRRRLEKVYNKLEVETRIEAAYAAGLRHLI